MKAKLIHVATLAIIIGTGTGIGIGMNGESKQESAEKLTTQTETLQDRITQAEKNHELEIKKMPEIYAQIDSRGQEILDTQKGLTDYLWEDGYYHQSRHDDQKSKDLRDRYQALIETSNVELRDYEWYNEPSWNVKMYKKSSSSATRTAIAYMFYTKDGELVQVLTGTYYNDEKKLKALKLYRTNKGQEIAENNYNKTIDTSLTGDVVNDPKADAEKAEKEEKEAKAKAEADKKEKEADTGENNKQTKDEKQTKESNDTPTSNDQDTE